jgi:hypothetical protein
LARGEQRRVHFERRILRGGANQDDRAAFDVRQERVLLRFVEAVDLVHEQHRARAPMPAQPIRTGDDLLDLFDARGDRADRHELGADHVGEQSRECRLAGARRAPKDQGMERAAIDRLPQRSAGPQQLILPDEFLERARSHALGEGSAGQRRLIFAREQIAGHGVRRWRRISNRMSAAVTATLSDSTPGRIGTVTHWSAKATTSGAKAGAFAADKQQQRQLEISAFDRGPARTRRQRPRSGLFDARGRSRRGLIRRRLARGRNCPWHHAAFSTRGDWPCLPAPARLWRRARQQRESRIRHCPDPAQPARPRPHACPAPITSRIGASCHFAIATTPLGVRTGLAASSTLVLPS